MESVKTVGNEFLGIESDLHDSSSSSSVIIAFPKLKSLSVEGLMELEEWDYGIKRTGNTSTNIMPRLSSLEISVGLWDRTTTLKVLQIVACGTLRRRYRQGRAEDWPKISHIPDIMIV
ncbi:uncharacterized protein LOC112097791 [Citrus clementina]|uniref:uncharacterized protein LOC112097791 n=1 Tax=Citrus clementina TaxID=85681 RepID=UPI000CECF8E3|nr:uncharacterized protein LOC112097791 [Citrus x clementina]